MIDSTNHLNHLEQCFPTFFGARHPYVVSKVLGGCFFKFKDKGIAIIGSTPGTC